MSAIMTVGMAGSQDADGWRDHARRRTANHERGMLSPRLRRQAPILFVLIAPGFVAGLGFLARVVSTSA